MRKLDPKAVWLFFFRFVWSFALVILIVAIFVGGPISRLLADKAGVIWGWFLIFVILYFILCYIWAKLTYHFWRYELTDEAVKIEKGVIIKKYISIPYERIQNVDIYRGVLARLLGLSDLHIQTAGYAGVSYGARLQWSEGRLPGLSIKNAEELRENLIQKVKGTKQGL